MLQLNLNLFFKKLVLIFSSGSLASDVHAGKPFCFWFNDTLVHFKAYQWQVFRGYICLK